MTQPDWAARFVQVISAEIKRLRTKRGLSAQQLSDACAALGHDVPRSVLANLESGRREAVTVPELCVLSEALNVSLVELLLGLGHESRIEILPGQEVSTTDAMLWFRGDAPLPGTRTFGMSPTVATYLIHKRTVDRWELHRFYAEAIRDDRAPGTEEDARRHQEDADRAAYELSLHRAAMKSQGLQLPETPPQLPLYQTPPPSELRELARGKFQFTTEPPR